MNKHAFRHSALIALFALAQFCPPAVTAQPFPSYPTARAAAAPEVLLEDFRLSPFALLDTEVPVRFALTNLGEESIKSLTVSFTVDTQTFETELTDLDIPAEGRETLTISCPAFEEELTENFSFTLKAVNGREDFAAETKTSPVMRLHVRKTQAERVTLIEPFTSESCVNCPRVEPMYKEFYEKYPEKVVVVAHHCVLTDSYTKNFDNALIPLLYSRNVPAWVVDRKNLSKYIEFYEPYNSPGPRMSAYRNESSAAVVDAAVKRPGEAFIRLAPEVDREERTIKVDVSGYLQRMVATDSVRLTVYLAETDVEEIWQSGAPSHPYYHDYITRHCFTADWGDPIKEDGTFEATYEMEEVPLYVNLDNAYLVAVVSNYDPEDNTKCEVYNAATIKLDAESVSVADLVDRTAAPTLHGGVFTLPAGQSGLTLYRADGTTLRHAPAATTIDLKAYPAGVYFIAVQGEGGAPATYKVVNK